MDKITFYLLLLFVPSQHKMFGQENGLASKVEKYIHPYVETNNFSGNILISQKGKVLFNKAYGFANFEFEVPNKLTTIFHIASLSKTFTAAAILLLEQSGLLSTEDHLSKYIPDYPAGDKITIHHLLSQTSGITDVNNLAEFDSASLHLQTPETLVSLFKYKPLEFQPGEKYLYSNSNYNLLAFIIEQVSKMKYGDFLKENIFRPLGMDRTLHQENMTQLIKNMAEGYSPDGNFGLQKTPYLDWTSKTGNGSLATTANDLDKWNKALLGTAILNDKSKNKLDSGYGWYLKKQFDKNYIYMSGRSPGFSAYIGRYPEEEICIIVLSNIYVSLARQLAIDLAGILFKQPVELPVFNRSKISKDDLGQIIGKYKFGKDFYRPDFTLEVTAHEGNLYSSYGELISTKPLQFIQRSFWSKITFIKDGTGKINGMTFDNFKGEKVQ